MEWVIRTRYMHEVKAKSRRLQYMAGPAGWTRLLAGCWRGEVEGQVWAWRNDNGQGVKEIGIIRGRVGPMLAFFADTMRCDAMRCDDK